MTVSKMKMFGSFQKLVSLLFSQNSHDITLKPNAAAYTVDSVVSLPAVDGDCVLLSVGEASSTYLPSATAASTYLAQSDAASTYLSQADAVADYLSKADAVADYLSKADAASDYQPLHAELTAIAGLGAGIVVNDGASGAVARSVEAVADAGLSVSNGSGVSGNPSLSLSFGNILINSGAPDQNDHFLLGDWSSGVPKKVLFSEISSLIGPGGYGYSETWLEGTSVTITHNLFSKDVIVQIYDVATGDTIMVDQISRPTNDTIGLVASEAPTAMSGWRVLVQKIA